MKEKKSPVTRGLQESFCRVTGGPVRNFSFINIYIICFLVVVEL